MTGRPSVSIMLGHDTLVRQHYKSEHWARCRNQTPPWYDWKIVESDAKPEQTKKQTFFIMASSVFLSLHQSVWAP